MDWEKRVHFNSGADRLFNCAMVLRQVREDT